MALKKTLGSYLLMSYLMIAWPGSIPTAHAQEIGRWVGKTSQGFEFVFTITPERTIERIEIGFTLTCPSGIEETQPRVISSRGPGARIVDQRFVWGSPVRDGDRCGGNDLISGEFISPTEARGAFELLQLRFRVDEETVGAQLCSIGHVTWEAAFHPESGSDIDHY